MQNRIEDKKVKLEKYVDELTIPEKIESVSKIHHKPYFQVIMKEVLQKLHRDLPPTKLWAYNGVYPGPTFEVMRNKPILVNWINDLPVDKHLLPVDTTVHGAEPENPTVRTVVHLHGANVSPESDGYPEAWFTNGFKKVGPYFSRKVYYYPNIQPSANLIYHDHTLGITRLNVYAGLIGNYIIRDRDEEKLHLPKDKYEMPLLIQDKSFNNDGSLFYPAEPDPPIPDVYPSVVSEFFGDTILVNGKVWPYVKVEPRLYRFRIANGSNSRFYNLMFKSIDTNSKLAWFQIGTDGSLLEKPVPLTELLIAPAERADILIDFSGLEGKEIIMLNNAPTPFPGGTAPDPDTTGQIIKFVIGSSISDISNNMAPLNLVNIGWLNPNSTKNIRDLTLVESKDKLGRTKMLLDNLTWDDPITEKPLFRSTEIWRLINLTADTHPIHLHLVQFQILDRQPFDVNIYNKDKNIVFTGAAEPPAPNEKGWKDTVRANPGMITRIIARFVDFSGVFPWHCHILEHEDHEMMRPYEVIKK